MEPLLHPDYYSNITKEVDDAWKKEHDGKNVSDTVKEYLLTYLGEPLHQLIRYVQLIMSLILLNLINYKFPAECSQIRSNKAYNIYSYN